MITRCSSTPFMSLRSTATTGNTTADGAHWVYRFDGHRTKCWFQVQGITTVRKGVHRTAQHRVARSDKNETAPARAVVDAHAELQRSPSPEASQPRSPRSPIKAADADAASSVSAGLVAAVATAPSPILRPLRSRPSDPRPVKPRRGSFSRRRPAMRPRFLRLCRPRRAMMAGVGRQLGSARC